MLRQASTPAGDQRLQKFFRGQQTASAAEAEAV